MSEFDRYHQLLGISSEEQPPSHYRLLDLPPFEADVDVIDVAAKRQLLFLSTLQNGPQADQAERLLHEVSEARTVLLNVESKRRYDAALQQEQHAETTPKGFHKVVMLFFRGVAAGVAMLIFIPFTLSYRFAYFLTTLSLVLLLVGIFWTDEMSFLLIMISICCLLPGVWGMLSRFVGWVNELPEKMNDPDPAVRRRAGMMVGWIMGMFCVFVVSAFLFLFVREIWLHGWSR